DEPYGLPDADLVEVAIDDVGHHRRAFAQCHIGDRIGDRRAPHHAVSVDRAVAGGSLQFGLVAEAERADRTRVVMHRPTGIAFADYQLAFLGRFPKRLSFRIGLRGLNLALLSRHLLTPSP